MTTDNKLISANDLEPSDEFRSVIINLIRCLDIRGGLKEGDKIEFVCRLEKYDNFNYIINDVGLAINKPKD